LDYENRLKDTHILFSRVFCKRLREEEGKKELLLAGSQGREKGKGKT